MPPAPANLLADLPVASPDEDVSEILTRPDLRIERIVSTGQASPPGFWYDQPWDEWALVLAGAARLQIADAAVERSLGPGDHLLLPAGTRHRVAWTSPDVPTVWLAVHCPPRDESS